MVYEHLIQYTCAFSQVLLNTKTQNIGQ